ncbi:chitosanase [Streptomyces albireticuli]|uniref:chitosanase n=1 Tax=Streptomyces albireticuli TaxID=1940 RepID=UPI001E47B3B5|nr:chitosanase [Streptomyces albireticuli]MCD9140947.1 chitosanase [Streptomyces albireticuli]MCD9161091.1 chitosanase [Streptomyces albireticuli]MCD9190851.1 chitosanase [Streptomyces albireticuli]
MPKRTATTTAHSRTASDEAPPQATSLTPRRTTGKPRRTTRLALVGLAAALPALALTGVEQAAAVSASAGHHVTAAPLTERIRAQAATGLDDPRKKDIAMRLVSSAENSSLDWRAQFTYIEDIGDGRGYTAGIIGFCSGTGDMLDLAERYTKDKPGNPLAKYLPALRKVNGSDSHAGLGKPFEDAWHKAAQDKAFQAAQEAERDRVYFGPSVAQAKADGLRTLGQFIYYDAIVMHGPGSGKDSFGGIRKAALAKAKTPAQGGDEKTYLGAFLDARKKAMQSEEAHSDTSRVDTAQRVFLNNGNFELQPPLKWKVYGDSYEIKE